ncbi:unnamed protein product [Musa acuminata subsp. burmannicoides]
MDCVHGDAESKHEHLKTHPAKAVAEDGDPPPGNENEVEKETTCSSSATSDDSSEDFFQFDPAELSKSVVANDQEMRSHCGAATSSTNGFLILIDDDDEDSILAEAQPVGVADTGTSCMVASRQSPPVQVMERLDVPDTGRIPSSIFTRDRSTMTPMEWSVASNESLFSIHVGTCSFSRDHLILMGRSGEFTPIDSGSPVESCRLTSAFPGSVPVGNEGAGAMKGADQEEQLYSTSEGAKLSTRLSHRSDSGSASSFQSFAFPVLTGKGSSSSMMVEHGHPLQTDTPKEEEAAAAGENKWCPCFSCCSSCC